MLYGIIINVIILAAGTAAFDYAVSLTGVLLIAISLLLAAFCFSALGVLLASPASTNPSNVMMLSSLVCFPLIFISGIFVPIASLQGIARVAVCCSPITYLVAGFDLSLLGSIAIPRALTWAALIGHNIPVKELIWATNRQASLAAENPATSERPASLTCSGGTECTWNGR